MIAIGLILGIIGAGYGVKYTNLLGFSQFSRAGLTESLEKHFGNATFADILTEDILIAAYSFNAKAPRFYSKYFLRINPGIYDVLLREAVGGSSSAPVAFNPEVIVDKYNITEVLVDGGVICVNPSGYSYYYSKWLTDQKNIKVFSLGTGEPKATAATTKEETYSQKLSILSDLFWSSVDSEASDQNLRWALGDNFVRLQVYTTASLATFGPSWYKIMKENGKQMWETPLKGADDYS